MSRARFFLLLAGALLGPIVVASIWLPVLRHYYVPTLVVDDALVARSRDAPSDDVLATLGATDFMTGLFDAKGDVIAIADRMLAGSLEVPGLDPAPIKMPFDSADLERAGPRMQLGLAALGVPRIFLHAYNASHDDRYLRAATESLVAYANYERRSLLPKGLQWNDHALAAGVQVLADFWRAYRHHSGFDPETAKTVLALADRSGKLLSKPAHFTFATNHGVMQNVALLHLALAFPELPDAPRYAEVGLHRLEAQMRYYMSGEGVVLEHSLGYHVHGTSLVAAAIGYVRLLGKPIPAGWQDKLDAALRFNELLRRPDGTVPQVGDTAGDEQLRVLDWAALPAPEPLDRELAVLPVAGYSILWNRAAPAASQTVVAWSNFDGHGHKHADELSVTLWAAGRDWWSNVGYWPYDSPQRDAAVSWDGSSAPHRAGEDAGALHAGDVTATRRKSQLLATARGDGLSAVEVERKNDDGYSVRRQVVQLDDDLWIVADQHRGAGPSGGRVIWSAAYDLSISEATPNCYLLEAPQGGPALLSCLVGSEGTVVHQLRGSAQPFAGWQVVNGQGKPSSALVVDGRGDSPWLVTVWLLGKTAGDLRAGHVDLSSWQGPDRFSVTVQSGAGRRVVERAGETLSVTRAAPTGQSVEAVRIQQETTPNAEIGAVRQAFVDAESAFPRFRDALIPYRARVSVVLLFGWLIQEITLAGITLWSRSVALGLRIASCAAWIIGAFWLHLSYFVVT